jgi:hypothetical protein
MAAFTFNTVPSTVFGPGAIARVGGIAAVALADARAIDGAAW